VAGADGQVAVSWYGTDVQGDMNTMPSTASWNVYVSEITNAASKTPNVTTGIVQQDFHHGVICTMGTGCTGDGRMLLDFFDMQFDKTGNLGVVYTRDQVSDRAKTEIAYAYQTNGCLLTTADCAPTANLPEFPTESAPVLLGVGLVGAFAVVRRRRRRTEPLTG
jgi:MYXO-CTERM domain-containing protein